MITRLYLIPSTRRAATAVAAVLACAALLAGCGFLERIFDPVDDDVGKLVRLEPRFATIEAGMTVELAASIEGNPGGGETFAFDEDSGGRVVSLSPLDGRRVLVTGVAPGQADVHARLGDDEGLAVVTVR